MGCRAGISPTNPTPARPFPFSLPPSHHSLFLHRRNRAAASRRRRRSRSAALNRFGTPAPRRPSNRAASLTSHRASLFSLLTSTLLPHPYEPTPRIIPRIRYPIAHPQRLAKNCQVVRVAKPLHEGASVKVPDSAIRTTTHPTFVVQSPLSPVASHSSRAQIKNTRAAGSSVRMLFIRQAFAFHFSCISRSLLLTCKRSCAAPG